jgi:trk/ktr system potassium uptake protein
MNEATFTDRIRAFQLTPTQILVIGFASVITVGTILLSLPFAAAEGRVIAPLDALFTATSAICVTGLITKDTPVDFSLFGQTVILVLIQIGGLGYMTFSTVMAIVMGKRIGLRERLVIQETFSTFTLEGLVRFTIGIIQFTVIAELVGGAILTFRFIQDHPPIEAAYLGLFHSVSAFNNAGFSLFSTSLVAYRGDWLVNGVILVLIVLGGLGFLVYHDILRRVKKEVLRLSLHTKVVLITSLVLIVIGSATFFLFERQNPTSLEALPLREQILASVFQSVAARTGGFNTVDIGALTTPTLYMIVLLMFIGASPGGTGGGIKTSTFAVMAIALWSTMRAKEDVTIFYRRLSPLVVAKAFFLASLAMILITGVTLVLLYSDHQTLQKTLFEVASATGTVGFSTGDGGTRSLAAVFSDFGKSLLILCMVLGRIGPLVIGVTALSHVQRSRYRYPEGKLMIG